MATWSEVSIGELGGARRLDAEFYQPKYVQYAEKARSLDTIGNVSSAVIHPVEVRRVYEASGLRILLAQNIRHNHLEFAEESYMPADLRGALAKNQLISGDIVMTRSGANYGDTACYLGEPGELFASADCLIIRPNKIPSGYLSTYLNTEGGRALVKRGVYGGGQPHIAPTYVKEIPVPRLGELESRIHEEVQQAYSQQARANQLYREAEMIFLRAIGIERIDLRARLAYERKYTDVRRAKRLDAEYFNPQYQNLIVALAASRRKLSDVARLATRRFQAIPGETFHYIEISDVTTTGTVDSKELSTDEAPSRAQWIVKSGDLLTATVRPIRRLTGIVSPNQDGFVCSSGFAVLSPTGLEPELLLVYLRLQAVCQLLDIYTTASMYPAISASDLMNIPVLLPEAGDRDEIVQKTCEAIRSHDNAMVRLQSAKARVERATLQGR